MIIDYDHNPRLTVDQKLQSLVESIRLMSDEITTRLEEIEKEIKEIQENN